MDSHRKYLVSISICIIVAVFKIIVLFAYRPALKRYLIWHGLRWTFIFNVLFKLFSTSDVIKLIIFYTRVRPTIYGNLQNCSLLQQVTYKTISFSDALFWSSQLRSSSPDRQRFKISQLGKYCKRGKLQNSYFNSGIKL